MKCGRIRASFLIACAASCRRTVVPAHTDGAPSMTAIAGGTFTMGGNEADGGSPARSVTLRAFQIDRTEVTVDAYAACVAAGRCSEPLAFVDEKKNFRIFCNWKHPEDRRLHPVNCVDWAQASSYCAFAGKRLPTEEEWEFAARAGPEERTFPWGNEPPDASRVNACGTECPADIRAKGFPGWPPLYDASDGFAETAPVGSYPRGASKDGVLDLAGNVWEWTASEHAPDSGKRVLRGGSFGAADARTLRSNARFRLPPSTQSEFLGLRCAK